MHESFPQLEKTPPEVTQNALQTLHGIEAMLRVEGNVDVEQNLIDIARKEIIEGKKDPNKIIADLWALVENRPSRYR